MSIAACGSEQDAHRSRILRTATRLFARRGIAAVNVDDIIAEARSSRTTFYRNFRSKENLVAEYLRRLDAPSLRALFAKASAEAAGPRDRVLGVFDALRGWFANPEFCGCPFTTTSMMYFGSPNHPAHRINAGHKRAIRAFIEEACAELGCEDPADVAADVSILMEGAIASIAVSRSSAPAMRARNIARRILDAELRTPASG